MDQCARCGHRLGTGSYCTSCGHPVSTGTPGGPLATGPDDGGRPDDAGGSYVDTAERPAVAPTEAAPPPLGPPPPAPPTVPPTAPPPGPLPAYRAPGPARYPLFADEATPTGPARDDPADADPWGTGGSPPSAWDPLPSAAAPRTYAPPEPEPEPGRGRSGPVLLGLLAALLLVGVAVAGVLLLLGGGSDDAPTATDTGSTAPTSPPTSGPTDGSPSSSPPPSTAPPGEPVDVAREATAQVPATAPPGTDVDGNTVTYDASNMLDGSTSTCWRVAGDASGDQVVFRLPQPVTLQQVGLVNGYAKKEPGYDGYTANRRITSVEWVLDDGTTVPQQLEESRNVQDVDVPAVTTSTVTLRLLDVTAPGKGKTGRDYTAISEVSLVGTPQG